MHADDPASKGRFTFELEDAAGKRHRYEVTQHRVREGLRISLSITALGLEALAGMFKGGSVRGLLDADLSGLDLSIVRAAVMDGSLEGLIFDVLRHTFRDGISLDVEQAGNGLDGFRGNFAELYQAAWRVIQGNGWTPLPRGLLDKASEALGSGAAGGQE